MAILQCDSGLNGVRFAWRQCGLFNSPGRIGPTLHLPLYVEPNAKQALTPFRLYTIRLIRRAADDSLGLPICHAAVFIHPNPPGEDGWYLLLSLVCVAKEEDLPGIRKAILSAVRDAAAEWTAEEQLDYREHIYFEVEAIAA